MGLIWRRHIEQLRPRYGAQEDVDLGVTPTVFQHSPQPVCIRRVSFILVNRSFYSCVLEGKHNTDSWPPLRIPPEELLCSEVPWGSSLRV